MVILGMAYYWIKTAFKKMIQPDQPIHDMDMKGSNQLFGYTLW